MRISDWSSDVCSSDLYQLIPNSNPPRYHTRYDGSIDQQLTQLLDYMLEQLPGGFYTLLIDKNGYCPTHNTRYSRQPTGDIDPDTSNVRNTQNFNDPVSLGAAVNPAGHTSTTNTSTHGHQHPKMRNERG